LDYAEEVLGAPFVADDEATEVLQPGEEAFDLPAPTVPAQRAAVLGLPAARASRGDQLDSAVGEARLEAVAVVGLVANQPLRRHRKELLFQRVLDESDFDGSWRSSVRGTAPALPFTKPRLAA
jgi:hypothetical protein